MERIKEDFIEFIKTCDEICSQNWRFNLEYLKAKKICAFRKISKNKNSSQRKVDNGGLFDKENLKRENLIALEYFLTVQIKSKKSSQ